MGCCSNSSRKPVHVPCMLWWLLWAVGTACCGMGPAGTTTQVRVFQKLCDCAASPISGASLFPEHGLLPKCFRGCVGWGHCLGWDAAVLHCVNQNRVFCSMFSQLCGWASSSTSGASLACHGVPGCFRGCELCVPGVLGHAVCRVMVFHAAQFMQLNSIQSSFACSSRLAASCADAGQHHLLAADIVLFGTRAAGLCVRLPRHPLVF